MMKSTKEKEDSIMTIIELYAILQPLIQLLGTVCLIVLTVRGAVFAIVWVIRKLWVYILVFGAAAFVLFSAALVLCVL